MVVGCTTARQRHAAHNSDSGVEAGGAATPFRPRPGNRGVAALVASRRSISPGWGMNVTGWRDFAGAGTAGRNRVSVIRRELPRTEDAGWEGPYRIERTKLLPSVCPRPVHRARRSWRRPNLSEQARPSAGASPRWAAEVRPRNLVSARTPLRLRWPSRPGSLRQSPRSRQPCAVGSETKPKQGASATTACGAGASPCAGAGSPGGGPKKRPVDAARISLRERR